MNSQFRIAQANGNPRSDGTPLRVVSLAKPQSGQAVVIHLDRFAVIDFTAIAGENITLVRVGDRLIVLFDNQATVSLEGAFDNGAIREGLGFLLNDGRSVDGPQFATLFPITTDPSILPAAADAAANTGGRFGDPNVDPLAGRGPLALLGSTELDGIDFGPFGGANTVPIIGTPDTGRVDDEGLSEGNLGGPGDLPGEAITFTGSLDIDFGQDLIGRSLAFASSQLGLSGLSSKGEPVNIVITTLNGQPAIIGYTGGDPGNAANHVFTVTLDVGPREGAYTFTLLRPLDHPIAGTEDSLVFSIGFVATDGNGDSAAGVFRVLVNDDSPETTEADDSSVDEEGLGGNPGEPSPASYAGTDLPGAATTVLGALGVSWGADRDLRGPGDDFGRTLAFVVENSVPLDGEGHPFALTSDGVVLAYRVTDLDTGGQELVAYKVSDTPDSPVLTVVLDPTTTHGTYVFTLTGNLDHHLANDEDDLPLAFGFRATDADGDPVDGVFTVTVDDDAPVVDPQQVSSGLSTADPLEGAPSTVIGGSLGIAWGVDNSNLFVNGGVSATTGGFGDRSVVFTDTNVQVLTRGEVPVEALHSNGDPVRYVLLAGGAALVAYTGDLAPIEVPADAQATAAANVVFVATLSDADADGGYRFTQYQPLDHVLPDSGFTAADISEFELTFRFTARDADGDSGTGAFRVQVNDTIPTFDPEFVEQGLVDEDGLNGGNPGEPPQASYVSSDQPGEARSFSGALGVSWEADDNNAGLADRSLAFRNVSDGDPVRVNGQPVTSNGHELHYALVTEAATGFPMLVGYAGVHPSHTSGWVFTVALDDTTPNGTYHFNLLKPLDHRNIPDDFEDDLLFAFDFTATDADGDTVDGAFTVLADDDAPVAGEAERESVDEEDLPLTLVDVFTPDSSHSVIQTGSLSISWGADDGAAKNIHFSEDSLPEGLTSDGVEIVYGITTDIFGNDVLTASKDDDSEDVVFTVSFLEGGSGTYIFTLIGNLDHFEDADTTLPLTFTVDATDADGDTVQQSFTVDVQDETPSIGNPRAGTVEEEQAQVAGDGNEDTGPNPEDADHPGNFNRTTETVTRSLDIHWGADDLDELGRDEFTGRAVYFNDDPDDIVRATDSAGQPVDLANLSSRGERLLFSLDDGVTRLTARSENGRLVFDVTLTDDGDGSYTFTLYDVLDQNVQGEDSYTLTFDFTASDGDGDVVSGSFDVNVIDDVAIIGRSGIGRIDEEHLSGNPGDTYADGGDLTPAQGDDESLFASGSLGINFGADGPAALDFIPLTTRTFNFDNGTNLGDPDLVVSGAGAATIGGTALLGQSIQFNAGDDHPFVLSSVSLGIYNPTSSASGTILLIGRDANGNVLAQHAVSSPRVLLPGLTAISFDATGTPLEGLLIDSLQLVASAAGIPFAVVDNLVVTNGGGQFISGPVSFGDLTNAAANVSATDADGNSMILTSGGEDVNFALLDPATLVGYLGDTPPISLNSEGLVFSVTLSLGSGAGAYDFELYRPLDHAVAGSEDDLVLTFHFNAQDGDGDVTTGTFDVIVDDDAPAAGAAQAGLVDEDNLSGNPGDAYSDGGDLTSAQGDDGNLIATGSLGVSFGADGPADVTETSPAPQTFNFANGLPGELDVIGTWIANGNRVVSGSTVAFESADGQLLTLDSVKLSAAVFAFSPQSLTLIGRDAGGVIVAQATVAVNNTFFVNGQAGTLFNAAGTAFEGVQIDRLEITSATSPGSAIQVDDLTTAIGGPRIADGPVTFTDQTDAAANVAVVDGDGNAVADLMSGGEVVEFVLLDAVTLVGYTGGTPPTATDDAQVVFSVVLSGTDPAGSYEFALRRPLDHGEAGSEDDLVFTFDFTAKDADGDTTPGSFNVTVDDDGPVNLAHAVSMSEGETLMLSIDDYVDFGADGGDGLPVTLGQAFVTNAPNGVPIALDNISIAADGRTITIVPGDDFGALGIGQTATLNIPYTALDADGDTVAGTIRVTVNGAPGTPPAENHAPVANDITVSDLEDAQSIVVTITGTDVDSQSSSDFVGSFIIRSLPANGTLYLDAALTTPVQTDLPYAYTAPNELTLYFVPDPDWNGTTDFEFTATDQFGVDSVDIGTATIEVASVNDAPVFARIQGQNVRLEVAPGDQESMTGFRFATDTSADGRYVVFVASPTVIGVAGIGVNGVYLFDRETGLATLVSIKTDGTPSQAPQLFDADISADGRYVLFTTAGAIDAEADIDGTGVPGTFVRDLLTGTTERVSVAPDGTPIDGFNASISPDGRFVHFQERFGGEYTRDLVTDTTIAASGNPYSAQTSADGHYTVFVTHPSSSPGNEVFLRDNLTGTETRISPQGTQSSGGVLGITSLGASISADGRYVIYRSNASDIVQDDTNGGVFDIFVYDRITGTTIKISQDFDGGATNGDSAFVEHLSYDARYASFHSDATDLVPNDGNGRSRDAFTVDTGLPAATIVESFTAPAPGAARTASGVLGFSDVDVTDTHTVAAPAFNAMASNVASALGTLTATVTTNTVSGVGGRVTWEYHVDAALIQYLGAGEVRVEAFDIQLDDGNGGTATETITITLYGTNDAPVADDVAIAGVEDGLITVTLAGTEVEAGDSVTSFRIVTLPANGTLYVDAAMTVAVAVGQTYAPTGANQLTFYFRPDADWSGTTRFDYTASDTYLVESATGTATIDVAPDADQPVLMLGAPAASGDEDTAIALPDVAAAVADLDGSEIVALSLSNIPEGAALGDGVNSFTATSGNTSVDVTGWSLSALMLLPPPDFNGLITLNINATAIDTAALSTGAASDQETVTQTIEVTVDPVADAPRAVDDIGVGAEDTPLGVTAADGVLANDTDPDIGNGDTLSVVAGTFTTAQGGTITFAADGSYTYVPPAGFNGTDSVDYTVVDSGGLTDTGKLALTVSAVNDAPVIELQQRGGLEIVAINSFQNNYTLLTSDGQGGFAISTGPTGGTSPISAAIADIDGDGNLDVVTAIRFTDQVSVLRGDGRGGFAATLLNIGGGDDPVDVAVDDIDGDGDLDIVTANSESDNVSILRGHGQGGFTASTVGLSGGDRPEALALDDLDGDGDLDIVTANTDGTVSVLLNDGQGGFSATTIPSGGVDAAGVALADLDGDGNSDIVVTSPYEHAVKVLWGDGQGGFTTISSFAVGGVAPNPVAIGDFNNDGYLDVVTSNILSNNLSMLLGDGQRGFTASTVAIGGGIRPLSLALGDLDGDGNLDIVTANYLTFDVSVLRGDGQGGFAASIADTGIYQPLSVAIGDVVAEHATGTTDEDTPLVFGVANGNAITISDVDADGGDETVTLTVAHGAVTLASLADLVVVDNGTGSVSLTGTLAAINAALDGLTYQPAANYNGSDTLNITVNDNGNVGTGGPLTATRDIDIVINPVDDAPLSAGDIAITDEDTLLGVTAINGVLANDTDPDTGDTLAVVAGTFMTAQGGTITFAADGSYTYTPAANFNGTDSVDYTVIDSTGLTDTGALVLTVNAVNDAPIVSQINAGSVSEDDAVRIIDLLTGQSDPENDPLSATNITVTDDLGNAVAFTDNLDGTISIDPAQYDALATGQTRTLTVSYDVSDGAAATPNTATLVVTGADDGLFSSGSEFVVNERPLNEQWFPSVATLNDGNIVIAWYGYDNAPGDTSGSAIKARIVDPDGQTIVSEFLVNDLGTAGSQLSPTVAALGNGGFVIAWSSFDAADGSGESIKARIFDANGGQTAAEFVVDQTGAGNQIVPSVSALANGNFVVTWQSTQGDGNGTAVYARIFEADGDAVADDFLVNEFVTGNQTKPSVTALEDGRFVVLWTSADAGQGDTSGTAIKARIFNADGSESVSEFQVNQYTNGNQVEASVAALAGGGFVVTWQSDDHQQTDQSLTGIKARIFDVNGQEVVPEFVVNENTISIQAAPSVTALADGGFVVTWQSFDHALGDTDNWAINARVFDANGNEREPEFLVNEFTVGEQAEPAVAALNDGGFIVTWWSRDSQQPEDTSVAAVKARIFHAAGEALAVNDTSDIAGRNGFADGVSSHNMIDFDGRQLFSGGIGAVSFAYALIYASGDSGWLHLNGDQFTGNAESQDTGIYVYQAMATDSQTEESTFVAFSVMDTDGLELHVTSDSSGTNDGEAGWVSSFSNGFGDFIVLDVANANEVNANSGNDTILGNAGANRLNGGEGDDAVYGNDGNDTLLGGLGNDFVDGGAGSDVIDGLDGNDILVGGSGDDSMLGGDENDWLDGGDGGDIMLGGNGNDRIDGDAGNDTLIGGFDNDTLTGGAGADRFVFAENGSTNADQIVDYDFGDGDTIDVAVLLDLNFGPASNVADFVRLQASGADQVLQVDTDGTAGLADWTDVATLVAPIDNRVLVEFENQVHQLNAA